MTPQQLRASLLQEAFSGRLTQQRPEDGTADALLQSIRLGKHSHTNIIAVPDKEIPYEIPGNWRWVYWKDCGTFQAGSAFKNQFQGQTENPIPFYKVASLKYSDKNGILYDTSNTITEETRKQLKAKLIPQQSIIFAKIGESIRLNRRCLNAVPCCIDNNMMAFTADDPSLTPYIFLWSTSIDLYPFTNATSVPAIRKSDLEKIPLPLPPLAEQQRILAKLEELLPLVDQYGDAAARLADYEARFPDDLRKSLLQEAITGRLVPQRPEDGTADTLYEEIQQEKARLIAEKKIKKEKPLPPITEEEKPFDIPDTWKWVRIGDIALVVTGSTPDTKEPDLYDGNIPFIRPTDLDAGRNITTASRTLTEKGKAVSRSVRSGSTCVCCIGGSLGKCGFLNVNAVTNQQINTISSYIGVDDIYMYYFCCSPVFQKNLKLNSNSTTLPIINKSKMSSLPFPLPPLEEQRRIVKKIEELLPLAERIRSAR